MVHAFIIKPDTYNGLENEEALMRKCKEWGLLSDKASKPKTFFYKGNGSNLACSIIGYVDQMTAVIEFDNKQQHCIHPSYLKEMQAANYSMKVSAATGESVVPEGIEVDTLPSDIPSAEDVRIELPKVEEPTKIEELQKVEELTKVEELRKPKARKEKTQKLQLPEEKVQITATVKEFATVPNNFSDNDDEVVIYEPISIVEPETEIGSAWSSHSATLKKLELEIGDKISFEAKIIQKKLTKHPVPYKINNPSKIQKEPS
ncbi:MAG: hypothetical protein JWR03_625 [Cohnella sp.]|nr:hypothetical protein [Cohnella sp.]